ncbi:MAG TPA: hypothetical protein VF665_12230 [Longimicrobium sp.]|jgi:hypothetical protein|uniref:hypothetical protein n=1 Tax=Longimicrobium sp. TaxID=2029185 RepID=UPI002EDA6E3B
MEPTQGVPAGVLIRDLMIFQLKTVLDGIKDAIVIPASFVAVALDMLGDRSRRGRAFYSLMAASESFDRWLNAHAAARTAQTSREGLFGGSEPGDGSFIGGIEGAMSGERGVALR